jgi:hypothetical protein
MLTMAPEATGGDYGAYGDVFAWGVAMCMLACQTMMRPPPPPHTTRDVLTEGGDRLLRARSPAVAAVVELTVKLKKKRRPCSMEVRDQLLQEAGVWPDLGAYGCLFVGVQGWRG